MANSKTHTYLKDNNKKNSDDDSNGIDNWSHAYTSQRRK